MIPAATVLSLKFMGLVILSGNELLFVKAPSDSGAPCPRIPMLQSKFVMKLERVAIGMRG